jgi:hypothetical protein
MNQLDGLSLETRGGIELIDEEAREQYSRRLTKLKQDLENAEECGNSEHAAEIKEEIRSIVEQIKGATALGGRRRRFDSTTERSRKAVSTTLGNALQKLAKTHEPLHRHLSLCLKTGSTLSYEPDSPILWAT